jgi:hypothetical protein
MTRRKKTDEGYSPLELAQWRLRMIAANLEEGIALPSGEFKFLISALGRIGSGDDANAVLGVKARRGERKTSEEASKLFKMRGALAWVASAIRPEAEDGKGISLDSAFDEAAEAFGYSYETLRTYWGNHPEWRTPSLSLPLSLLPMKR